MFIPFKVCVPLEARWVANFEHAHPLVAKWQGIRWTAQQFAPDELTITLAFRSGHPRASSPPQFKSEQWQVLVCKGVVVSELVESLGQALRGLVEYLQRGLSLEMSATIIIGGETVSYHYRENVATA